MANPSEPQTESSEKPAKSEKGRRDWLSLNVLIPIEDNYRVTMNARVVGFWVDFFVGWKKMDILKTLKFILGDCKFTPTVHDWSRLRPQPAEERPAFLDESPTTTFDRLSKTATGWGKVVCEITRWGLTHKDADGNNRMPEAYDNLIAKAHEFGRPQEEIDRFLEAKKIVLRHREIRDKRSPLKGRRKGVAA